MPFFLEENHAKASFESPWFVCSRFADYRLGWTGAVEGEIR